MCAAIGVAPTLISTGTATAATITYAATPGTPMPSIVLIIITISPPRKSCPSLTTSRIKWPKFSPSPVKDTVPIIRPIKTHDTPTPTALLAPSAVASMMVLKSILVSFLSQDAAKVAKMEATAAYSGVYPSSIIPTRTTKGISKCPLSFISSRASGIFSLDSPLRPNFFASRWTEAMIPK